MDGFSMQTRSMVCHGVFLVYVQHQAQGYTRSVSRSSPCWACLGHERGRAFIFCAREKTVPVYEDFFLQFGVSLTPCSSCFVQWLCGKTVDSGVVTLTSKMTVC